MANLNGNKRVTYLKDFNQEIFIQLRNLVVWPPLIEMRDNLLGVKDDELDKVQEFLRGGGQGARGCG